ncbi:MAG: hypothetical protein K0U24_04010 [Gammaproteobacteria bacterium]|nr:hypothetical protein [Gammaproteobacteria bacterium]MCH9763379.1 hypothetical protein [Gammaproteobacteria bacterium]
MKVDLFKFTFLVPGSYYKLILLIDNKSADPVVLNIDAFSGGVFLDSESGQIIIKPGLHQYTSHFKAKKPRGMISVYPEPGVKWAANLYGIQVEID